MGLRKLHAMLHKADCSGHAKLLPYEAWRDLHFDTSEEAMYSWDLCVGPCQCQRLCRQRSLVAADLPALGSNKGPPLAECGAASDRSVAPEQGSPQGDLDDPLPGSPVALEDSAGLRMVPRRPYLHFGAAGCAELLPPGHGQRPKLKKAHEPCGQEGYGTLPYGQPLSLVTVDPFTMELRGCPLAQICPTSVELPKLTSSSKGSTPKRFALTKSIGQLFQLLEKGGTCNALSS